MQNKYFIRREIETNDLILFLEFGYRRYDFEEE